MATVKVEDMASVIVKELEEYSQDVTDGLKESIKTVSKECVKEIKEKSPSRSGKYKKGWKNKVSYEDKSDIRITVYNSKKPQLAHLLEFGHAKVNGGRVSGKPHISPAEQNAEKKLMKKVKVIVRGGGD